MSKKNGICEDVEAIYIFDYHMRLNLDNILKDLMYFVNILDNEVVCLQEAKEFLINILKDLMYFVNILDNEVVCLQEAKEFLINILKENNNIMRALEIFNAAKENEIAMASLNRAKKELNIRCKQIQGKWYWELEHLDEEYQDSDKKTDNVII